MKQLSGRVIIAYFISLELIHVFRRSGTMANPPDGVGVPLSDDDMATKIDTFVQEMMDCRSGPGLNIAVVKNGKTIISRGYGYTTAEKSTPITSKTQFAIGSLTKAFTTLLTVKAMMDYNNESSKNISVDTPISQYLPDFRVTDDLRTKEATLRDLMSHRMSIPGYVVPLATGFVPGISRKDFVRRMQFLSSPLSFRDKMIYNNYMYVLVAHVLEHLSGGETWEDLVRDVIFRQLGMKRSGIMTEETDYGDDFALPCYMANDSIIDLPPELFSIAYPFGPGGTIYSTAEDMVHWMNLMLSKSQRANPPGLGSKVISRLFEPGSLFGISSILLAKPEFPISHQDIHYGMAWVSATYRGYKLIYHTGGIVTHSSRLWLYPDLDIGIYLSARGGSKLHKKNLLQSILYYVSDLMIEEDPWFNSTAACHDPVPWITPANQKNDSKGDGDDSKNPVNIKDTTTWSQYTGNYSHPFFGTVEIFTDCLDAGDQLCFQYGQYGSMTMTPVSEYTFHGRLYGPLSYLNPENGSALGMDLVFSLDDSGHATSLNFKSKKEEIHFQKHDPRVGAKGNGQESSHRMHQGLSLIMFIVPFVLISFVLGERVVS